MKRKNTTSRLLIYLAPAALAAIPLLHAAPEPTPTQKVERHIQVRTADAPAPGLPVPPPAGPVTFLGVEVAPVDEALGAQLKLPPDHGLVVRYVVPDSPAAVAGIQKFDVLTRLDDQRLIASRQLSALVRSHEEGDVIQLTYVRGGSEARTKATLTKRVPPPVAMDTLRRLGDGPDILAFAPHRQMILRTGEAGDLVMDEDRLIGPMGGGAAVPHVRILRPSTRVIYTEGDLTLEVTAGEQGRRLDARRQDGTVLFSGPIDTPEQRAAVPADLQKHLEKLDALEPAPVRLQVPPAGHGPWPGPGPGSRADLS